MYKNVAGQKLRVFAFNVTTNRPVLTDGANITCKVSKDNDNPVALGDTNPTEVEDGYYLFDLTQDETNANTLDFYPESSTDNVVVIVPNFTRQTVVSFTGSGSPLDPADTGVGTILTMVRAILGDLDSTNYTYSDDRLRQIISVAAFHVYNIATFSASYTIDINNWTILPDPINDQSFMMLTAYKSACLIATYELKNNAGGFLMKDGPTTIDTSSTSKSKELISKNYCEMFQELLLDYLINGGISGANSPGAAILGPYSPGADMINWNNTDNRGAGWR